MFLYDGENRLRWVKRNGSLIADYDYDDSGLRISKKENGITTYYQYFEGKCLLEESWSGKAVLSRNFNVYVGDKNIATFDCLGQSVKYIILDRLVRIQ